MGFGPARTGVPSPVEGPSRVQACNCILARLTLSSKSPQTATPGSTKPYYTICGHRFQAASAIVGATLCGCPIYRAATWGRPYCEPRNTRNGEGGIRTRGRASPTQPFQDCSLGHSDTSPGHFTIGCSVLPISKYSTGKNPLQPPSTRFPLGACAHRRPERQRRTFPSTPSMPFRRGSVRHFCRIPSLRKSGGKSGDAVRKSARCQA